MYPLATIKSGQLEEHCYCVPMPSISRVNVSFPDKKQLKRWQKLSKKFGSFSAMVRVGLVLVEENSYDSAKEFMDSLKKK